MDSAYPEPGVESDRIRDLLASDRRLIGQARALRNQAPLRTASFRQPLLVRVRRRWRLDRSLRLRVRLICCGLALVLTAALCLWLRGRSYAAYLPIFGALSNSQPLARAQFPRLVPENEQQGSRKAEEPSARGHACFSAEALGGARPSAGQHFRHVRALAPVLEPGAERRAEPRLPGATSCW